MASDRWIDLLDPSALELGTVLPDNVHPAVQTLLLARPAPGAEPRPRLRAYDNYIFGMVVAASVLEDGTFVAQEIDVLLTAERLVTVRKTPPGATPFELAEERAAAGTAGDGPGMCLYRVMDSVAEQYLDLIDRFDNDIDQLEDVVDNATPQEVRTKIASVRHDLLHIRRALAPMRDLTHSVVDGRLDLPDGRTFPREVELHYADVYDKFLRAADGIDLARDLLSGVRDYAQAKIANDQNELVKKFTVIAAMLLFPTFIVGLYGMNFDHMPEYHWRYGYQAVLAIIILTTVGQYIYFRRKKWI